MDKLLIVVDFQNDFVDGALGFDGADKLEDKICDRIKKARKDNEQIIFTFDTHEENYLNTQEGKFLPVEHCIKGSNGHKLYGKVAELVEKEDILIEKPTFGSIELCDYLKEHQFSEIELCGLVSNICILSNAILAKTFNPEATVIVDENLTDSFDEKLNKETFDILKGVQVVVK